MKKFFAIFVYAVSVNVFSMELSDFAKLALDNNSELNRYRSEFNAFSEIEKQTFGALLPSINVSLARSKVDQERSDQGNLPIQQKYTTESDAIILRQSVYNPKRFRDYERSKVDVISERYALEYKKDVLEMKVVEAYFRLLKSYEEEKLLVDKINLLKEQSIAAQKAIVAGYGTKTEKSEISAAYDKSMVELISSRQKIKIELSDLSYLTGKKIEQISPFKEKNRDFDIFSKKSEINWERDALENNNSLLSIRKKIESAKLNLESQKMSRYPTLDLNIQISRGTSESSFFLNTETKSKSIGLNFFMPIYQGGIMKSVVRESAHRLDAEMERLKFEEEEVQKKIKRSFYSLSENLKLHRALLTAVNSAEIALDANKKSTKAGVRRRLDILVANQKLIGVKKELIESKINILSLWLSLNMQSGSLDNNSLNFVARFLR